MSDDSQLPKSPTGFSAQKVLKPVSHFDDEALMAKGLLSFPVVRIGHILDCGKDFDDARTTLVASRIAKQWEDSRLPSLEELQPSEWTKDALQDIEFRRENPRPIIVEQNSARIVRMPELTLRIQLAPNGHSETQQYEIGLRGTASICRNEHHAKGWCRALVRRVGQKPAIHLGAKEAQRAVEAACTLAHAGAKYVAGMINNAIESESSVEYILDLRALNCADPKLATTLNEVRLGLHSANVLEAGQLPGLSDFMRVADAVDEKFASKERKWQIHDRADYSCLYRIVTSNERVRYWGLAYSSATEASERLPAFDSTRTVALDLAAIF